MVICSEINHIKIKLEIGMNVFTSASLLFPDTRIDDRFLNSLNAVILKKTYRDMIFHNHPDRALHVGISKALLTERFKSLTQAYACLDDYVQKQQPAQRFHTGSRKPSQPRQTSTTGRPRTRRPFSSTPGKEHCDSSPFRKGPERSRFFPSYELMLGQYLYYSGFITLQELVSALNWQRKQRPPVGELAMKWGIIDNTDIISILRSKRGMEKFADCALRMGLFSQLQYRAVLYRQQNLQQPLGGYFVNQQVIRENQLMDLLNGMKEHNMNIRFSRARERFKKSS